MKFELPTWAYAAVASAGIMCGSTYLALRPAETASLEHAVERDFPDARPAPKGLAERAQKMCDTKEYTFKFFGPKHGASAECTDGKGRLLKDCPRACPEAPDVFGEMTIDGKTYGFTAIADRVDVLTQDGRNLYDIYWWGALKGIERDGPYKYDHGRKTWQKVQPWWPARKNQ